VVGVLVGVLVGLRVGVLVSVSVGVSVGVLVSTVGVNVLVGVDVLVGAALIVEVLTGRNTTVFLRSPLLAFCLLMQHNGDVEHLCCVPWKTHC
jgi:hypothetical protein